MYTALLVDDERSLRESISELVDWGAHGFRLLGVAENGLDALQFMEETAVPDLLITDIKMPVMDGIELAKRIREEHPTVKIVFLSGYDEFQYAVAGIRLNIVAYLLKPVAKAEIEEMLQRIHDQISEEIRQANDLTLVQRGYFEQIEVMKISFLISLLTETYTNVGKGDLEEFLASYDLEFLKEEKALFAIQLKSGGQDTTLGETPKEELIRFSLSNIVRSILGKYVPSEVFLFSSTIICLISEKPEQLESALPMLATEIVETSRKLLNQEVCLGVSEQYSDIFQTKKAYRQAMEAVDYARHSGKGEVIYVTDIEAGTKNRAAWEEMDEYALLLALKTGDREIVKQILAAAIPDSSDSGWEDISAIKIVASVVYTTALRALRDSGADLQEQYTNWYYAFLEGTQYQSLATIKTVIHQFCQAVLKEIQSQRSQHTNSLVAKSLAYLEANFQDPEVSLKSVSQHLSVSPTYFSAVFKKETGQSFIELLTELKMNRAKELVMTTEEKMFEIALQCGYSDQHYFSYSFKKFFGISPTKMRSLQAQP